MANDAIAFNIETLQDFSKVDEIKWRSFIEDFIACMGIVKKRIILFS